MLKKPVYRNKKLLALAKDAPCCFACMKSNDGSVVACHSNSQRFGKGLGIKASDAAIAFMCNRCHAETESGKRLTREQRTEVWEQAFIDTMVWLFESGLVDVVK